MGGFESLHLGASLLELRPGCRVHRGELASAPDHLLENLRRQRSVDGLLDGAQETIAISEQSHGCLDVGRAVALERGLGGADVGTRRGRRGDTALMMLPLRDSEHDCG